MPRTAENLKALRKIMPIIEFSEKFSVGVASLDAQHQKLFALINRLYDAMREARGKEALAEIVSELERYAFRHFAAEEAYLREFKFPGLAAHLAEHETFVKQVLSFKQDLTRNPVALSLEILPFMKDWISRHILVTDRAYAACFRRHGVK